MNSEADSDEQFAEQFAETYRREYLQSKDHIQGTALFFRRAMYHCGLPTQHADVNSSHGRGVLQRSEDFRPLYENPGTAGGLGLAYAVMLKAIIEGYLDEAKSLDKNTYSDTLRLSTEIRSILKLIHSDLEGFVKHDVAIARTRTVEGVDNPWYGLRNFLDALKDNMAVYGERLEGIWMQYKEAYNIEHMHSPNGSIADKVLHGDAITLMVELEKCSRAAAEQALIRSRNDKNGVPDIRTEGEGRERVYSKAEVERLSENRLNKEAKKKKKQSLQKEVYDKKYPDAAHGES